MTEVVKEFVTPDRSLCQATSIDDKKDGLNDASSMGDMAKQVATVTPPECGTREESAIKHEDHRDSPLEMVTNNQVDSPEDRKVRFDHADMADSVSDSPSSNGSQRGLVSRRGGRCASPGRVACASPKKEPISEYQTYRSPTAQRDASDSVPSLTSDTSPEKSSSEVKASTDDGAGNSSSTETKEAGPLSAQIDSAKKGKSSEKKSNVSFSPVPPPRDATRTPTRSPTGRFQSLPVLDDDTLRSPGSFFLSPHPPTPSSRILRASGSFDKLDLDRGKSNDDDKTAVRQPMRSPKTPRSPRTPRRDDRDRFLTTPTDFAIDYGKHPHSGSFDSSNGKQLFVFIYL